MVSFTTVLSLAAAAPILASYAATVQTTKCDISSATISGLPPTIAQDPSSTLKPSFVGVAIGTQNYTCSPAGTYTATGALAELFDISCIYGTSAFDTAQDVALSAWQATSGKTESLEGTNDLFKSASIMGYHYFVPNPAGGSSTNPKWDFTSKVLFDNNPAAFIIGAKISGAGAPTGKQDVDWLHLKNVQGSLATEVYRTDTRLGQPPASCTPGSPDIFIKYSSKYWFLGSKL